MTDTKHDKSTKLLWVDLEMTGLDPKIDKILEVATIVTDMDFNELGRYQSAVFQHSEVLNNMNEFCQNMHSRSGLVDRVKIAPAERQVVSELTEFISDHFGEESAILAGNSIHQDRRFIRQWWPQIDQLLHYRMLDVSSFKIIMQNKYDIDFTKAETHQALNDIEESIAELKFYLQFFQVSKPTTT